jgi:LysM repeat protein
MKRFLAIAGTLPLLLAGGCMMMEPAEETATKAEVEYLRGELRALRQEQAASSANVGRLQSDLYAASANQGEYATQAQLADLARQIESLRGAIAAESSERAKGQQRIYDDIVKKMTDIAKQQQAAAAKNAAAAASARTYGSGWEHVVQPGESLSAIAAAYHVKVDSIVRANEIKNPNALRAGQKLFIPDPN